MDVAKKIAVLIAEPNHFLRYAVASAVKGYNTFAVTTWSVDPQADFPNNPDVVVMRCHSLEAVGRLKRRLPRSKIVAVDCDPEQMDLLECVRMGITAFVLRDEDDEGVLAKAIQATAAGEPRIPSAILSALCRQIQLHGRTISLTNADLTAREREIVQLLVNGRSNKEIASELNISEQTAKTHVHNILQKNGWRKRLDLMNRAIS
jgi:DNA-binding NarL/FixJ family response regulator